LNQLESHHLAREESNPENRVELRGECGVVQPAGALTGSGLGPKQTNADWGRGQPGQYRGTVNNEASTRNHALVSIGTQFLLSGNLSPFCLRATKSWLIHELIYRAVAQSSLALTLVST
jgi:hypothetical protein